MGNPEITPSALDALLPKAAKEELADYEEWVARFRAGEIGDIKMQKIRLQLGTYAQRQEGVQMQRIKFPGGAISSEQLTRLADVADRYASGFIHFTTREDAQLYYIKLEQCGQMMRELAAAGITTREACGNTVRNITACYRSGISASEPFDVTPYCQALFQFMMRNKFNQVMGRKFKIAFESCAEDHAGMRYHDMGFKAVSRLEGGRERRGFRTYIGGGLGGIPILGCLYSEFLPEEDLLNLAAATVRVFDRYGERKSRMQARMKFLIKKMGWEAFKRALDEERRHVELPASANDWIREAHQAPRAPAAPADFGKVPEGVSSLPSFRVWHQDSVVDHKAAGYKGVNVRLKLGDLLSDQARQLALAAKEFSRGELRITIEQNLFLRWVPEKALPALYKSLLDIGLASPGAETMEDTTTCPGADTCRLGITSAKGLGAAISAAMGNGMSRYKDLARNIRVKISGCPNGCAQHGVAQIGFQGAALKQDNRTVPGQELFVGGGADLDNTSFGERIGKYPTRNCPKVVEALLALYDKERRAGDSFNAVMARVGKDRIKEVLAPLEAIPSFEQDPEFYKDWAHENESFAIRSGIKGECAGVPVQEKVPVMAVAREHLAQAEAFLHHKELEHAQLEACETMAYAARVPLYARLIDPFTSEQVFWEFENVFVRAGLTGPEWKDFSTRIEAEKKAQPTEARARALIDLARKHLSECERLHAQVTNPATVVPPPAS